MTGCGVLNDEERFRREFPAIYGDIERRRAQNGAMRRAAAADPGRGTGWRDYEQIRMIYDAGKGKLRIRSRIHKTAPALYGMAEMTVQNRHGVIQKFHYAVTGSTFLPVDEELSVGPGDLDGIRAEISYMFTPFLWWIPVLTGKAAAEQIEEAGIDIIGKGKVLHPISRAGRNKVDIIYWRDGTADYCYDQYSYKLKDSQDRFLIHLPAAIYFELDQGFALAEEPNIGGSAFLYSKNHGIVEFDNWAEARMVPASRWKKEGDKYPEIGKTFDSGYLFVLPQAWKRAIEKDGVSGNDDFYLSLEVGFTCRDGNRYSLEIDSRENPKAYSGGAEVEIPCMHLLWGCIEKDAELEVYGKGRIPVSQVQIGDKVLSGSQIYETVCDVVTGDEEILKYIRADGQELKVTMDHPVMTEDGFKPARELFEGERILFQDGAFYPVEEIYDEPYYDKVYSLNLEHGEGFFANRIFVGDFKRQNSFQKEEWEVPQEILAELEKFKTLK